MPLTPEAQAEACKVLIQNHTLSLRTIFPLSVIFAAQEAHLIELEAELEAQEGGASEQEELKL